MKFLFFSFFAALAAPMRFFAAADDRATAPIQRTRSPAGRETTLTDADRRRQEALGKTIDAENAGRRARDLAVETNSQLTTSEHQGKRTGEPHKDDAHEDAKVGESHKSEGVETAAVVRKIGDEEVVIDHNVISPNPHPASAVAEAMAEHIGDEAAGVTVDPGTGTAQDIEDRRVIRESNGDRGSKPAKPASAKGQETSQELQDENDKEALQKIADKEGAEYTTASTKAEIADAIVAKRKSK